MPIVDSHAHIFTRDLPAAPNARHRPDGDATIDSYLEILRVHGITHALLSAPSFLGTDNSYLLAALRKYPNQVRGTVIVDPAITERELGELNQSGVVGIRLNLFKSAELPDLSSAEYRSLFSRVYDLDWHVEIYVESGALPTVLPPLIDANVKIVIDHFGSPDPDGGVNSPGFTALLSAFDTGRTWTKLSAPYRLGAQSVEPYATALLKSAGAHRLLWGSDWPWTQHAEGKTYQSTLDWLSTWVPSESDRELILNETPAELFKLDANA